MRYEDEEGRPAPGEGPLEPRRPEAETSPAIRVERESDAGTFGDDRDMRDPGAIRAEDTEPYIGLQYIARLFKIVAMIVIVAIVAEVIAGLASEGVNALLPLLSEIIQGGVLAAMLWGVGDLTLLFIDVGHDMRAARVLLGRMSARMGSAEFAPRRDRTSPDPRQRDPDR
jgi:hypothetical protein